MERDLGGEGGGGGGSYETPPGLTLETDSMNWWQMKEGTEKKLFILRMK